MFETLDIIADIATNTADIATNAADIATNAADIATNAADITTLEGIDTARIGEIIESASITAPAHHVLCDGSALGRVAYADLYNVVTADLGTVTINSVNPGVVTLAAGDWTEGECIELTTTGALPGGGTLVVNTNYYVHRTGAGTANLSTSRQNLEDLVYIDTSGGAGAGVHTARFCPWGISTAANFLAPDLEGIVTVMPGDATVNCRIKTGPSVAGDVKEDQGQGHRHAVASIQDGVAGLAYSTNSQSGLGNYNLNTSTSIPLDDGTNGVPRTGTYTRPNMIGVNKYIKYE
jgi:hypothetical protein